MTWDLSCSLELKYMCMYTGYIEIQSNKNFGLIYIVHIYRMMKIVLPSISLL